MNKTKVYIPEPKDIIDKFKIDNLVSKGALQPVERYVLEEAELDKIVNQAFLDGQNSIGSYQP